MTRLHVPVPVPAIVAEPPGSVIQLRVWSAPAFGLVVTVIVAVSEQPAVLVHLSEYTPAAVKPLTMAVGEVAGEIVAVPGAGVIRLQMPVPVAAIVVLPPGSTTQETVWSAPALALPDTTTSAVSTHTPLPQVNIYVPAALKLCMILAGDAGEEIVAVPGAGVSSVQVPVPLPAIVTEPPGKDVTHDAA